MFASKIARPPSRPACYAFRLPAISAFRPAVTQRRLLSQTYVQNAQWRGGAPGPTHDQQGHPVYFAKPTKDDPEYTPPRVPVTKVTYLRPAIWALSVSCVIFYGLAYLEAKRELKTKSASAGGWLQMPHLNTSRRGLTTPTEVVTSAWTRLDPISKLSCGIIGANGGVHLSSFVVHKAWYNLWHIPARNVNYTHFTAMFVHSGGIHFFVNMYAVYNFMEPVGYSRLFEGSPYHTLSFYLSAGILSGFAQHWTTWITRIPIQKRATPHIFIRSGGASGAIFGIIGVFCMQYPHAEMAMMFIPIRFEAQYVLPALMLFDLVGLIRGYSFVSLGHAAHLAGAMLGIAYSHFDGKTNLWKPLVRHCKRRLQQS